MAAESLRKIRSQSLLIAAIGILCVVAVILFWFGEGEDRENEPQSSAWVDQPRVSSADLPRTDVTLFLEGPLQPGHNTIWCATGALAVAEMLALYQSRTPDREIRLMLPGDATDALASYKDIAAAIPPGASYANAGWLGDGILETIRADMAKRFPNATMEPEPAHTDEEALAYAYLQQHMAFPNPYLQYDTPVAFGTDIPTNVEGFGLRHQDRGRYTEQRRQAQVLYVTNEWWQQPEGVVEYVLSLAGDSEETQLIAARIPEPATLAEGIAHVESLLAQAADPPHGLSSEETLLVPEIRFNLHHNFAEMSGASFVESGSEQPVAPLSRVFQDIRFQLDRSGVRLESQAEVFTNSPVGMAYQFNQPFLLFLRRRDSAQPFFAMWVANDEILVRG